MQPKKQFKSICTKRFGYSMVVILVTNFKKKQEWLFTIEQKFRRKKNSHSPIFKSLNLNILEGKKRARYENEIKLLRIHNFLSWITLKA